MRINRIIAIAAIAVALSSGVVGAAYTDFGSRLAQGFSITASTGSGGIRGPGAEGRRGPSMKSREGGGIEAEAFLRVAAYGGILAGTAVLTRLASLAVGALGSRAARRRRPDVGSGD